MCQKAGNFKKNFGFWRFFSFCFTDAINEKSIKIAKPDVHTISRMHTSQRVIITNRLRCRPSNDNNDVLSSIL